MKSNKLLLVILALFSFLQSKADVEINETNFPDSNFREYLKAQTYGADGVITDSEIADIKSISVQERQISTLKGIEYFTALESLACYKNQLSTLDFSKNIALTSVACGDNQLTSLDVSKNTALTSLGCDRNKLTSLDVSKNTALTLLSCYSNQIRGEAMDALIASLPTIDNGSLRIINSEHDGNEMRPAQVAAAKAKGWTPECYNGSGYNDYAGAIRIDETNFPDSNFRDYLKTRTYGVDEVITAKEIATIISISVYNMQISNLKGIEHFTALTSLYCYNNQLTSLDVSKNTALTFLSCENNQLTSLDVSKNTALTYLVCSNNQLTSLDISKNSALTKLYCDDNQLTSLDVSKNTALGSLLCEKNQLTSLDVSKNTALTYLSCYSNQIRGESMDALVASLPSTENGSLHIIYNENEGNEMTAAQVAAAKAKGWFPRYYNGSSWLGYLGDIRIDETNFPDSKFREYLKAQTYGADGVITNSEIAAIKSIDVHERQISTLQGIEYFTALKSLACYKNQLSTLDVSKNTALTSLYCDNNQLTSLDLSKNTALKSLSCYSNQIEGDGMDALIASLPTVSNSELLIMYNENEYNAITMAQVIAVKEKGWIPKYLGRIYHTNNSYSITWIEYASVGVEINKTNFPDENFREYLKTQTYYGADGILTDEEISAITSMSVYNMQISNLKGIEHFTALTYLSCSSNQLTSLDVSKNTALTTLSCPNNQLTSLDVSKNTALTYLYCYNNQLTSLDVSKNTALTSLHCYNNQLTSLDVSNNSALKSLDFRDNQLTSLDVSNNSALKSLDCHDNQLTSLDVSKNTALTSLSCPNNQLTSLDVSKNTALTYLSCYSNQIRGESMDALVASLPTIDNGSLRIINSEHDGNEMRPAQVAAAKAKGWTPECYNGSFWLDYSGAFRIDETNFPDSNFRDYLKTRTYGTDGVITDSEIADINSIDVHERQISTLQGIEYFTALKSLACYNNQLSTLDVSKNTALTSLSCSSNQLTTLDVSNNSALTLLSCSSNQLTTLDVTKNTALTSLSCSSTQLTTLDVSKNTALTYLSCSSNQLTSLDVSNNSALTSLSCDNNQLTTLDVSNNTTLTSLYCDRNKLTSLVLSDNVSLTRLICRYNQLTSLNVSKNTALTFLYCHDNQLTSLDVSKNTALTSLYCYNNQLTSLDVSNTALTYLPCYSNQIRGEAMDALVASLPSTENGSLNIIYNENEGNEMTAAQVAAAKIRGWIPHYYNGASWGDYAGYDAVIEINETNFPDENFREYLKTQSYGTDGVISIAEFVDIKTMDVSSKQIASLKGIEYFTCLTKLKCRGNQLTSLDVSRNSKLIYLVCDNNKLTSLDVSKNTALMELYCQYNQLSSLDMSNNIALTDLACYDNQLTSLDLSKNSALTCLDCANNQLTSLDLSKNTELTELRCENNQLKSLDVSNTAMTAFDCYLNQIKGEAMDALVASLPSTEYGSLYIIYNENEGNEITGVQVFAAKAKGWTSYRVDGSRSTPIDIVIDIDETNFPDPNFRSLLQAQTYGKDGVITDEEFAAITSMDVSCFGISNLKGIEFFSALKSLYCDNSKLTSLDVSKNTRLMELLCQDNQLTSLDVSKNTALTYLVCSNNQLTSLDISKNSALTYLDCANNQLTSLDVSKNTALTSLNCSSNQLTSLDVSNNTKLTVLSCGENQLTSLDVSKNTALTSLNCSSNQLTSLDVSNNTKLTVLSCGENQLTSFDVSKNTALTSLKCHYNELTALNVANNKYLKDLSCNNNQLTSLDVSKNTALTSLNCSSNQIKGEAMDALVESLPTVAESELKVINNNNEGNEMTTMQVASAKAKGWIPQYRNGSKWTEYAGVPVEFKLTYMVDGVEYKSCNIEYGATITPETNPEKETYRFLGWSEIPETMPSHDVTVTGAFERYFTVGNVARLVSFVINGNATSDEVELYDQNTDEELNIGDIILVVKWILNNDNSGPSNSRTRSYNVPDWTQYTAVQFDVRTTADTNIKEIRLVKGMEQTHQMMYQQKDAYTYTVVVYSLSNQLMKPENGNIVEITTDKNTLNGVSIENVIVALPTGETESYNGAHLSTNILQIEGEEGPAVVYDLKGNRQNGTKGLKKGVYIVNGKKVIVK